METPISHNSLIVNGHTIRQFKTFEPRLIWTSIDDSLVLMPGSTKDQICEAITNSLFLQEENQAVVHQITTDNGNIITIGTQLAVFYVVLQILELKGKSNE
ncbi:MAG: hypothetical protein F6K63_29880 [Moorea sp. SIO1G6]|uniref:hypothetical protein n=1 Tax=Moorena sp. SIO1G6 TaxID=2607840 RepID=UPI0013C0BBF7|nr:hypothetical protein [Moorena sp. SIO1G6]NET68380.1 hypothetical protein [Moorena sp. SIO1G6]